MQNNLQLSELKTLLISARDFLNSHLKLNKTKNIKYTDARYFNELSFLSLFGCCAEDGSKTIDNSVDWSRTFIKL